MVEVIEDIEEDTEEDMEEDTEQGEDMARMEDIVDPVEAVGTVGTVEAEEAVGTGEDTLVRAMDHTQHQVAAALVGECINHHPGAAEYQARTGVAEAIRAEAITANGIFITTMVLGTKDKATGEAAMPPRWEIMDMASWVAVHRRTALLGCLPDQTSTPTMQLALEHQNSFIRHSREAWPRLTYELCYASLIEHAVRFSDADCGVTIHENEAPRIAA